MVKNFWITGDTHGAVASRVKQLLYVDNFIPEENALIILGDSGLNYYLNKKDHIHKREVEEKGVYIYCVRGNHEARPSDTVNLHLIRDENVDGEVWIEDEFPHIRYFRDWGAYTIQGLCTLVIGGAYSVDKHYRLARGWQWFEREQLDVEEEKIKMGASFEEMLACKDAVKGKCFDLILSHTCPLSFQPTDLFLEFIDQSTVDNSMEVWMEKIKDELKWNIWLFGHYHKDRIELPHVEQFYTEIEPLENIIERWKRYDKTGELDWWLPLAPRMKRIVKEQKWKELHS